MKLCDLRNTPGTSLPFLAATDAPDRVLILTVAPDAIHVCAHCPNVHVKVVNATPAELRALANGLLTLAEQLERR